jgi:hypothetical protein
VSGCARRTALPASRLDNGGFFPKLPGLSFANQPLMIAGRTFRPHMAKEKLDWFVRTVKLEA